MAPQTQRDRGAGGSSGAAQVVLFQLAGKSFAVELGQVEQIIDYRPPTKTPRRPPHVEGVIEHRGRYLALLNLRKRFGVAEAGPAHPAVLLVTGAGPDPRVGLVVDQVLRVLSLPSDGILAPPPRVFGIRAEFIRGVANAGGRPLIWLDVTRLLAAGEAITLLA
ncbi:MAG: CheW protein [candidate division NC10 bacterium]|jgi:purine-binding chemotaxis protein CheW|nr:CheW protein [candidate division NC10 bacterium]